MAYSVEDDTYIALYGVLPKDPTEDEPNVAWATERMREMEPLASGIQLADENLGRRPARFVSDDNLAPLDALRARYDPDGLFHPWMGPPARTPERRRERAPTSAPYLERPLAPPDRGRCCRRSSGGTDATPPTALGAGATCRRLLDPAPLAVRERAGARCPTGSATWPWPHAMPGVSAAMVDWWFDWHPREALRYRIWHPAAHRDNSLQPSPVARAQGPLGRGAPSGRGRRPGRGPRAHRVHGPRGDGTRPPTPWSVPGSPRSSAATSATTAGACGTPAMFHVFLRTATACCCAAASGWAPRCVPTGRRGAAGGLLLGNRSVNVAVLPRRAAARRSRATAWRSTPTSPRCSRSCTSASGPAPRRRSARP